MSQHNTHTYTCTCVCSICCRGVLIFETTKRYARPYKHSKQRKKNKNTSESQSNPIVLGWKKIIKARGPQYSAKVSRTPIFGSRFADPRQSARGPPGGRGPLFEKHCPSTHLHNPHSYGGPWWVVFQWYETWVNIEHRASTGL